MPGGWVRGVHSEVVTLIDSARERGVSLVVSCSGTPICEVIRWETTSSSVVDRLDGKDSTCV